MILRVDRLTKFFGNFIFAAMINLHLLNYAVVAARNTTTGYSSLLYAGCFAVAILIWLLQGKLRLDFKWLIAFGLLLIWYFVDKSVARISLQMLCAYVGMPLFIVSNIKYRTERVLYYTMIISLLFVTGFPVMLARTKRGIVDVDVAYSVLPSIIAGIVHFAYYRNAKRKWGWIVYAIPVYYMVQLFRNGLRGPLTCIFITILLLIVFQFNKDNQLQIHRSYRLMGITVGVFMLVLIFLEDLLEMLVSIFQTFRIDAYFITKTIRLLNAGDITNGRNYLWGIAWKGYLAHPIAGNGFDSFEHFTGFGYPHNFILQSLYDGGLLFFVPLLCVFVIGIIRVVQSRDKEKIAMLIFLFGFAFIYSFLSQDMYNIFYLWALIAFLLMQRKVSQITVEEVHND